MKPTTLSATLALAAACATSRADITARPLANLADPAEYAAFRGGGVLELTGQALVTSKAGDVRLAAGRLVTLDPATPYSVGWFRRYGAEVSRFNEPAPDPLFQAARRTTIADAEGRFRFAGLRAGIYLVRSSIARRRAVMAALVTVQEGDGNDVVLQQPYTQGLARTLGVAILSDEQASARQHRFVSRVSGTSCATGLSDPPLTEFPAREELVLNAGRRSADAVANVACRKKGIDLAKSCVSRIVCEGDAIVWM